MLDFLISPPVAARCGLAVFAAAAKFAAVGAPFVPGFRMVSFDPAAMRFRLLCMLSYKPVLAISTSTFF
jgi:hypothetical protein